MKYPPFPLTYVRDKITDFQHCRGRGEGELYMFQNVELANDINCYERAVVVNISRRQLACIKN